MATNLAYLVKRAKSVSRIAYTIAVIGMLTSYGTQVELLLKNDVGLWSYVIPSTIDLLAISASMTLSLPGLGIGHRKIAGWVLALALIVSVTANVLSGHNLVARAAHAWPVVAYMLGELLASIARAHAATSEAAAKEPTESKTRSKGGRRGPYKGAPSYSDRHQQRLKG